MKPWNLKSFQTNKEEASPTNHFEQILVFDSQSPKLTTDFCMLSFTNKMYSRLDVEKSYFYGKNSKISLQGVCMNISKNFPNLGVQVSGNGGWLDIKLEKVPKSVVFSGIPNQSITWTSCRGSFAVNYC